MMTATDSVLSMDTDSVDAKQQRRQTGSAYPPPTPLDLVRVRACFQITLYRYRFPDHYFDALPLAIACRLKIWATA